MTREEFIMKWQPQDIHWAGEIDDDLDALLSATQKTAMEEAAKMCECDAINQQSRGHDARAAEAYRLAVAIRGLMDQPPPPARGESIR